MLGLGSRYVQMHLSSLKFSLHVDEIASIECQSSPGCSPVDLVILMEEAALKTYTRQAMRAFGLGGLLVPTLASTSAGLGKISE